MMKTTRCEITESALGVGEVEKHAKASTFSCCGVGLGGGGHTEGQIGTPLFVTSASVL